MATPLTYYVQKGKRKPRILPLFEGDLPWPLFDFDMWEKRSLPVRLPDGEQGSVRNLAERLRPPQGRFFRLFEQAITPRMLGSVAFVCLELPIRPDRGSWRARRCYRRADRKDWLIEADEAPPIWDGRPAAPRVMTDQGEQELPQEWRNALLQAWERAEGSRPFNRAVTEILKLYRDEPDLTNREVAKRRHRTLNTVNNQQKQLKKKMVEITGVVLTDYKGSAVRYWREMGMTLPEFT